MKTPRPLAFTMATGLVGASLLLSPLAFAQSTPQGGSGVKTEQSATQSGQATSKKAAQVKGKKQEEKATSGMH